MSKLEKLEQRLAMVEDVLRELYDALDMYIKDSDDFEEECVREGYSLPVPPSENDDKLDDGGYYTHC